MQERHKKRALVCGIMRDNDVDGVLLYGIFQSGTLLYPGWKSRKAFL